MAIISLCPSITQLIFALGAGDRLVGVTRYCVEPAAGVAPLEKLGGTKNPNLERIRALRPELVFLNREENRREDAAALEAAGIATHVTYPRDVGGAIAAVRAIGEALGETATAARIAGDIEAARLKAADVRGRLTEVTWVYLIWRKPWMAVGGGTYIHHLISEAGGRNLFADEEEIYPPVSAQALAAASPRLIMLSSEPFPFAEKHIAELAQQTGLAPERFKLVDGQCLSWHGGMTARGLRYASRLLREAA
jgi:ABC-type Fe3+-hydroxamate transport system substrate-binding protein